MANPWTGEVALVINGEVRVLKLTLGALAGLEQALQAGSLVELVERFETVCSHAKRVRISYGSDNYGEQHIARFLNQQCHTV